MTLGKTDSVEAELLAALTEYNRPVAEELCRQLVTEIYKDPRASEFGRFKSILYQLRRKRLFPLMLELADALNNSGYKHPQVRRQYAQALIDQGHLTAAEDVLYRSLADPNISKAESLEAKGLLGRLYKQRYVILDGKSECEEYLNRAVDEYLSGYKANNSSYWHAINVVAVLMRAKRDGITIDGAPDPLALAAEVLETVDSNIEESVEPPKPWELATKLEALVALDRFEQANAVAAEYSLCQAADAFEIGSTLRQLIEIWQLTDQEPPGDSILPLLRSALLEREGGSIKLTSKEASTEAIKLEGIFGDNAPKTVKWYRAGLERTSSIARLELADGRGVGTAGLVARKEFFPGEEGVLLLTNAHVVSKNPADSGLPPNKIRANMQGIGETFEIDEVVWSSPQRELDASLLSIKGTPAVEPLPIADSSVEMSDPPPRVYVIGHPSGRDLEISLNDNRIVGANETFLHYRAATEPGSSGSPVFDQYGWEVIALHHGGSDNLPRIDNTPGTYQANEGIAISAIKNAILRG